MHTCVRCTKPFKPTRGNQLYCSHACYSISRIKQRGGKSCLHCGGTFYPRLTTTSYCSVECHNLAQRKTPDIICKTCGESFRRKDALSKGKNPQYCSMKCRSEHQWKTARIRLCDECCMPFTRGKGNHAQRFCSDRCRWNSQIKPYPKGRRGRSKDYNDWRKAVFSRDGRCCTSCGASDSLQAHHVKAWATHPELRYDVTNGTVLCITCHQREHPQMGVGSFRASTFIRRCKMCHEPIGAYGKTGLCRLHARRAR